MSWPNILYFISIALQVSGALILILFCWGNTEKRVLNTIFPANTSVHREDDDTVIISKDKLFNAEQRIERKQDKMYKQLLETGERYRRIYQYT